MKTTISVLKTAWRACNSWELWCAIGVGCVTTSAMTISHVELASPRDPAPWVLGLVVAMLVGVMVLWSDVANLLRDAPLGEVIRARDPRLAEVGRPFTIVVGYLCAAILVAGVAYAIGDLLSITEKAWFYGFAVAIETLALLGLVDVWRLNRRVHGWNSELLAIRDEADRVRRGRREQ